MGKVRIKALGDEEAEKKQTDAAKKRADAKRAANAATNEETNSPIEPSLAETKPTESAEAISDQPKASKPKTKQKTDKRASHSKSYQAVTAFVNANKLYNLSEAVALLPKLKRAKFDETVELHINTVSTGISGNMTLPHGTGKETKVVIADEAIIAEIEKGTINFDVILAEPQFMSKLAKVAKILGPRGLMPNPKNGTVTPNPQEAAKKYAGGLMNYKTEAKFPLLHLRVGKVSFGDEKLSANIKSAISTVDLKNIKSVTLKSTMSPGIRIDATTI